MENLFLFFFFLLASIFDAAFLSRFSILGAAPSAALAALIFYAAISEKNNFLWIMIPSVIFSIFSDINIIIVFILFASAYFSARFFGNRFKESRFLQLATKVFLSISIFYLEYLFYMIIFELSIKKLSVYFAVLTFVRFLIFIAFESIIFTAYFFIFSRTRSVSC